MESERTTRLQAISREAYRRMAEDTNAADRPRLLILYKAASKRTQAAQDLDYALEILEARAASVAQLRRRLHAATMRHADRGEEKTYNAKHRIANELKTAIGLLSRAAYGLVKAENADRLLYDAECLCYEADPIELERRIGAIDRALSVAPAAGPIPMVSEQGIAYMLPCPGCELEAARAADPDRYCPSCRMLADNYQD